MESPFPEHNKYDLWWKNSVIYCLDVETYLDSDGDGIGDFKGLSRCIDYLADLGVTCIWLMPFYPSPNRDDGYDVADYYGVESRLGDLGDLNQFMMACRERGIRVIADLVVNHTSDQHPWFQKSRSGPDSEYHNYYVWEDERPDDWETSLVFPGEQIENWTYDRKAGRYFLHHFYRHQPDLNPGEPRVREEMKQILSFWSQLGLSGFRVDAVPFLIEMKQTDAQLEMTPHGFLEDLSEYLRRRTGNSILLGEVNLPPQDAAEFFGEGDELQMLFAFNINQYLHLALARQSAEPLRKALGNLPSIPPTCQWAHFLTNHDELTLNQLTESERQEVFDAFGPEEDMQLYGRGIRRRLPPMLDGNESRLRLAYSILFSLPGTPVLFYGEEIGMGENLDIPGRLSVRTPMQWTDGHNAGFSSGPESELLRPITQGEFGPASVNVASQLREQDSMLSFTQRLIRRRRLTPELGMGGYSLIGVDNPAVLAHRCDWDGESVIALHNLSESEANVDLSGELDDRSKIEIWSDREYSEVSAGNLALGPWGYRWIRLVDRVGADLL
jgi:trehalose synthase